MPQSLEDTLVQPSDTAPLPEPQTTPTEPAAPSFKVPDAISSRMQSMGLSTDGLDSQDKLNEYLLSQYDSNRHYADFGRSAISSGHQAAGNTPKADIRDNQGADDAPEGAGDAGEFDLDGHFSSLWSVPKLDEQAKFLISSGIVEIGENGLYQAKPGYEAMALPVLNGLNQSHVAQREQMQKLFEGNFYQNIHQGLWPALEHQFRQLLQEQLGQQFQYRDQQHAEQSLIEKFRTENAAFLYTPDGAAFTPQGQKFSEAVNEYLADGLSIEKAIKLAKIAVPITNAGGPDAASTAAGSPAPNKPRDEQGRFLKGEGTPPVAVGQPTKQESFLDSAKRKAALSNAQGGYTESDPVIGNDGELDNLWDAGWAKHKAAGVAA